MKKRILCLILCVMSLVPLFTLVPSAATTDVLGELKNYTIDGEPFNEANYPLDPTDTGLYILAIREEGMTPNGRSDQFAFYIYFYDPAGRGLEEGVEVDLYMSFDVENIEDYKDSDQVEQVTALDAQYSEDNRFIRVKYNKNNIWHSNINRRIYHIYQATLYNPVDGNDLSVKYNTTFVVTGFEETKDLMYSDGGILTMELELEGTVWRDENFVSLDDPYHYQELATVYFTIPQDIYEQYERIRYIDTQFYLFQSTPIIVTNSATLNSMENIDVLKSGYEVNSYFEGVPTFSYGVLKYYAGAEDISYDVAPVWTYNPTEGQRKKYATFEKMFTSWGYNEFTQIQSALAYYFYDPDIVIDKDDNSFYQVVASGDLTAYVDKYSQFYYPSTYASFLCGVAPELYESAQKHNVTLDIEEIYKLDTTVEVPEGERSFWEILFNIKRWQEVTEEVSQILVIENPAAEAAKYVNDLEGLSETYKIGIADAPGFLAYLQSANGVVTLCRFANTQYECRELDCDPAIDDGQVWLARANFYQDVDVTSVTFERDGRYFVYEVYTDPVDTDGGVGVKNDANVKPGITGDSIMDALESFFGKVKQWLEEVKTALIVVAIVLVVFLLIWLILKLLGVFAPRQKIKIEYDSPPNQKKRKRK